MQKIGVFVCWCGSNIAATVDVAAVVEALKVQPGVVYATDYQYMCSASGQNIIKDAIKEYGLTGVVICSCSPRMHEATFRKTVQAAGLNPQAEAPPPRRLRGFPLPLWRGVNGIANHGLITTLLTMN